MNGPQGNGPDGGGDYGRDYGPPPGAQGPGGAPADRSVLDRMPPQAVEVEQAVLGAMMIDPGAIGRALEMLDETCFYHSPHNTIFKAILSLYERSEAVATNASEQSDRVVVGFRPDVGVDVAEESGCRVVPMPPEVARQGLQTCQLSRDSRRTAERPNRLHAR